MMINKRLITTVAGSKKYIAGNVILQWCGLLANIAMMMSITGMIEALLLRSIEPDELWKTIAIVVAALVIRFVCTVSSAKMSYLSSKMVKEKLRECIYKKLLSLGHSYNEHVRTSEVVQVAVEGVEQLEIYFGSYLPQFFYSMLAPITLFSVLCFVNIPIAICLLICVPLIPVAIAAVQTWAKKLLSKYWGQYTVLGDTFLENLQGLTTLKIYKADSFKNDEMNQEAEKFRKITMKVLVMQLNSIAIMDLIAYGGAALGIILSVIQYKAGDISLSGGLLIILLAADFFLPMRQLGSFFHIAMNGMAASDKIFNLLDIPEEKKSAFKTFPLTYDINLSDIWFGYEPSRQVLQGIDISFKQGEFTCIVGESGCGKSTVASILMNENKGYKGTVTIGDTNLRYIDERSLLENITYVSHQSYIFKGTVKENLLMGDQYASDQDMWRALEQVKLADFLRAEQGLETFVEEKAANLSGGQRQRLALARALLHDSPVYIFDEATSNIDVESENDIMEQIHSLAATKTVILISHRLANVSKADNIYVLNDGIVAESGNHDDLLNESGLYKKMWDFQQELEAYEKIEVIHHEKE